jgi:preprotein translocase subunit SecD
MKISLRVHTGVLLMVWLFACGGRERVLTVHLADYSDNPSPGRIRVEMPRGEAPLYAEAAPVLDDRDFNSASFSTDDSGLPVVRLCFAPGGRNKFTHVVERNVHRRLVFLVRGKLLLAPVIDSGVVQECESISGWVSADDAAALKRAIR